MASPTPSRVQTRQLSWKEICQKAEGKNWTKPEPAYEFGGNRTFESTDSKQGGPYSPTHG